MTYTPFIWFLLISALVNGSLAYYTRQYQDVPSVKPFRILMWIATAWALLYGLGISIAHVPLKIFIVNITYIPSVLSTIVSLALALEYTGRGSWLTRRRLGLMLVMPAIFLILAFTSQWHHLWRYDYQLHWSGSVPVIVATKGILYWVYVAYMLGLSLATFSTLVTSFRYHTLHFRNTIVLAIGMLIPVIVALLYVFGLTPVRGFDWIPTSFIWMGALYIWAVLRGRLFDVVPIARNAVVENMDDILIVLDIHGNIVDFNRAAQSALALSPSIIGAPSVRLPQPWAEVFQTHAETAFRKEEIVLADHAYELGISPIQDRRMRSLGRLFLFHNITSRKQAEADEQKKHILAQALQETSQALNSTLDYESVLEKILINVGRVVPIDSANIALLDDYGILHYVRFYGYMEHKVSEDELQVFSLDTSPIYKRVFETGEPLIVPDTHADPDWIIVPGSAWVRSFAVMPIRIKARVVGFLNLDSAVLGMYTPEHINNLRAFADQVAIAVENARLFATAERELMERKQVEEKLRQQNEYHSTLHQITVELLDRPNPESLLNIIAERAAALVNAQHGFMFLSEDDLLVLRAATREFVHNIGRSEPKPGTGVLGEVWKSGETIAVENYTIWELRDPDYNSEKLVAIAGVPIQAGGNIAGVLEVANTDRARPFSGAEIEILKRFALLASLVLDNTRLFSGLQTELVERKQMGEKLQKLSRAVEQSPASIVITDTAGRIEYVNPRFTEVTGYSAEEVIGKNPRVLKTDKTPPETYRQLWQAITSGGEWRGEFINRKKNGEQYYESASISPIINDQGVITHYLAVKEDITGQKKAEEELRNKNQILQFQIEAIEKLQAELREQAVRDPLTGLYNRRYLAETQERELAHAEREGYKVGFVMIDIDHFKNVNDTFGHEVGDHVLQKLAALIKDQTRLGDIVCRYGGEEILVILLNVTAETAFQITNRWRIAFMNSSLSAEFGYVKCTISCGISTYPTHGSTANELITLADKAMYQAKSDGRNRVVIWRAAR